MKLAHILGFGVSLLLVVNASANITPTLIAGSPTGSGPYTWSYDVVLDSQQNLISGSQLCLADIFGLTGTPTAPSGWTAVNQTASNCPIDAGVGIPNNAASVLYTYSGSTVVGTNQSLGTFTYQSLNGTEGLIAYGATAQKQSNSQPTANQGNVAGATSAVPEPTTTAMVGIGLGLMALARRRLAKKA